MTTDATTTDNRRHSLTRGFQTLTIDPSQSLRRARESETRRDRMSETWQAVGSALWEAVRKVSNSR